VVPGAVRDLTISTDNPNGEVNFTFRSPYYKPDFVYVYNISSMCNSLSYNYQVRVQHLINMQQYVV